MRALVVEDQADLRGQLSSLLKAAGFAVDSAQDGEDGLFQASELPLDIAVVDLGLPKLDGVELIRRVRKQGKNIPILILTARGRWQEKVEGLEAGADDYLTKPFQPEELVARVRALIRRKGGWTQSVMACGPITLTPGSQTVTLHGKPVDLTAYEYKVLEGLMQHAGEVLSKSQLSEKIYAEDQDRDSNVIEVFIKRLRTKLDPDGKLNPIETLRGRGYRLTLARKSGADQV